MSPTGAVPIVTAMSEPVTVVTTRRVKPGREAEYEAWLSRLVRDASALPGFLGTSIIRPGTTGPHVYTSVFRFDTVEHLQAFEHGDLRRRALAEVGDFVEADAIWDRLTGLEVWFTPPPGMVVPQPSLFRMALVMIAVVYGLVLSIGRGVALALPEAPPPLRLLATIAIEVFVMTYVVMPRITRWLARWIYTSKRKPR